MKEPAKRIKKAVIWTVLLLLLTVGVFAWLLRGTDLAGLGAVLSRARPHWLAAGACLVLGSLGCQAVNLRMLLRRCGQRISLWNSMRAVFIGFYFSGITPSASGGQPAQVWQLTRAGVAPGASAGALLLMQIAYQAVMIALGAAGLLLCGGALAGLHGETALLLYGFTAASVVLALLSAALFSGAWLRRVGKGLIGLLGRWRLVRDPDALCVRLERQMEQFDACAALLRRCRPLAARLLFVTLVQQLCLFSVPVTVYCALGLTGQPLWRLAAAQALLSIAVDTLPLPGAVGASESAFMAIQGLFFGPLALPAMLLSRGLSFYGAMALSALVTAIPQPCAARRLT